MTIGSPDSSRFLEDPVSRGQEQVVRRICARVAGPLTGRDINVAGLPLGGVEIWLDNPRHRWRLYHGMARELRLAGWHTEPGPDRLLLLGWSPVCLSHRARMLGAALSGRLADFDRTSFAAVMIATRLRHEGLPAARLPAEVVSRCRDTLRWPARLADLDGLERRSTLEPIRLRLAQVAGLESKVSRRCAEHLALASRVARTVAGGVPPARSRASGPRAGLTERMVCVSVPNRASAAPAALDPGAAR
ncbi:hypothetical protein ACFFV7_16485 [Nonomuraea spiralis]|uniref:Uncharacterized protein n=1 Tax=Nonomuraea spiralis TaxID=46182 RepID=A0ABV5IE25_9ACTN|nr:hypothetical protein [Nonomuraea spiralis]GGS68403.1 hypothetical protein GCM10010176_008510 [Nonomuraea spiralis]